MTGFTTPGEPQPVDPDEPPEPSEGAGNDDALGALLVDIARSRVDEQSRRREALESKAGSLLGFAGLIVVLVANVATPVTPGLSLAAVAGAALAAVAAGVALAVFLASGFASPDLEAADIAVSEEPDEYDEDVDQTPYGRLYSAFADLVDANERHLADRRTKLNWSARLLLGSLVLALVGILGVQDTADDAPAAPEPTEEAGDDR